MISFVFENCERITIESKDDMLFVEPGWAIAFRDGRIIHCVSSIRYSDVYELANRINEGDLIQIEWNKGVYDVPKGVRVLAASETGLVCASKNVPEEVLSRYGDIPEFVPRRGGNKGELDMTHLVLELHALNEILATHFSITDCSTSGKDVKAYDGGTTTASPSASALG